MKGFQSHVFDTTESEVGFQVLIRDGLSTENMYPSNTICFLQEHVLKQVKNSIDLTRCAQQIKKIHLNVCLGSITSSRFETVGRRAQ